MKENNPSIVTAKSSKKSAKTFHYGNIVSVLIPFPFFIFWFGASMFVYAMYRHHPNSRVGFHTQKGAYYYYALAGLLVPVLTFASGDFFFQYGWMLWIICMLTLIPLSIYEIIKINKEDWQDVELKDN
jgi:hypothetical protein